MFKIFVFIVVALSVLFLVTKKYRLLIISLCFIIVSMFCGIF